MVLVQTANNISVCKDAVSSSFLYLNVNCFNLT